MYTELTMHALCKVIDLFTSPNTATIKKDLSIIVQQWVKSVNIPLVLSETLIKVTAEHLAVKKLAAATQTRSWLHLCKAFNHDQHCSLARQDLIVPVSKILCLMHLTKIVGLLITTLPITPLLQGFIRIACYIIFLSLILSYVQKSG